MLSKLEIQNFRNLAQVEIELAAGLNIFRGSNAAGKTNLLEAIFLLSTGKSFRTARNRDLIKIESDFARVRGEAEILPLVSESGENLTDELSGKKLKLEVIIAGVSKGDSSKKEIVKNFRINDGRVEGLKFVGQLPAVLFFPEEIDLLAATPANRRKFLNLILVQSNSQYLQNISEYQKILRARRALLLNYKIGRTKEGDFDFWDEKLVLLAQAIWQERISLIDFLNNNFSQEYQELGGKKAEYIIRYHGLRDNLRGDLKKNLKYDAEHGVTSAGPHRDNWSVMQDQKDLAIFGSRGEWRLCVLALKFTVAKFFQIKTKHLPIILLDDPLSELDEAKTIAILKRLEGQQVILTMHDQIPNINQGKVFEVKEGMVKNL